jgi:phage tail-like protein
MPATGSRNDPYAAFNFIIKIDGVTQAGFSECSGLSTESDVIEYRTGGDTPTLKKIPGLDKYANIVFKRGYTNSKELWQWRKKTIDGNTQRCSGSIVLQDEGRKAALTWSFSEAWPRKWDGPTFNGKTNEVAIEMLEIVHEGLKLE